MSDFWLYALLLAVIIVLVLAFYAGKLLKQVAQQKQQQAQAKIKQQQALNKHDKKVFDSVLLITRAMQQEQCEFDEGCWRLSVLLSSLKTVTEVTSKFPGIYTLYDEIKGFAIRDARKALTKKERMREDYQRMKALNEMHDKVVADLDVLHQFTSEQLTRLTA
ncbi:hypothetical protein CMT41_17225 [Colwellia sp. MT41]|uniref:Coproporphyrinogen III oxidase n=1 Tax=Colwellia marinimaniae TaxID=1513592 RepID=A0ABQ0MW51_9GAMM|nr:MULTISPECIES: DUF2489 domain-containing protein [Colwellia]ALO36279.1 hypothetical protein CMT41_17225 [Colwellia sp. MT41]GAW96597.1 coproporphyrinogen III oxidase [Colwellia marinimaniae]